MFSQERFVMGLIVAELTTVIVTVITMLHIHVSSQEGFVSGLNCHRSDTCDRQSHYHV